MSERLYRYLLCLYPTDFRRAHGEDALQLFRDRLRDETGFLRRMRLWFDIFLDLAISLPRLHARAHPAFAAAFPARSAGAPLFLILEDEPLRPAALVCGCAITLAALALIVILANHLGPLRNLSPRAGDSEVHPINPQTPATNRAGTHPALPQPAVNAASESFASTGSGFKSGFAQSANSAVPAGIPPVGSSALDPERQRVLDAVIANLDQHYFDSAVAHRVADALVAHQRSGADALAANDKDFAALLTTQMRDVSHDMHLEVVYSATPLPKPSPQDFAKMLATLQKDNCLFRKVEILPGNIGYLKLDAFLAPSDCGAIATAAMTSLNHVNALIFDLRDNRGGTSEMVSLISSYLFDHPEYMFDPRRVPTPQSWTSSPVPGSRLANKPVFILTSSTTISAAEQFTYDLKMLKRATVIGEVTAGGAHAGVFHRIDDHFGVAIPENRAVNPYSQADWEGVGITPDIKVPAALALKTALQQARAELQKNPSSLQHDSH